MNTFIHSLVKYTVKFQRFNRPVNIQNIREKSKRQSSETCQIH